MNTNRYPNTVAELIQWRASETPNAAAYAHRIAPGRWEEIRWRDFWTELRRTAAALRQLGLQSGEHLVILAKTCWEWHLFEHAGMLAGAIIVGIDPHASPSHIKTVLSETSACIIVCDQCTPELLASVDANAKVIQLDEQLEVPRHDRVSVWSEVSECGLVSQYDSLPTVKPEDPATLIYTSGTTGDPKAIRFTHRQLMVACGAIMEVFPLEGDDSTICWLPMAHLFQRMVNLVAIRRGTTIYFVDDPREVVRCAGEVGPAFFVGVPRFFEKLYEGIEQHISQMPPLRQTLVRMAIDAAVNNKLASDSRRPRPTLQRLKHKLLDRFVLRKLRSIMGPNIRCMITGAAPIAPCLLEFFSTIGWPVFEAYGISENSVPIAANRPGESRFGSVGKPLRQNDVRIALDGEILVKGEGLFGGYWNEVQGDDRLTEDGYHRTGDIGRFDHDGYLYLMGRKCDIIKTSTGRRIAPSRIEAVYSQSKYINHVIVIGNGRKHLVALCTLNTSAITEQLCDDSVSWGLSEKRLSQRSEVKTLLREEFALYEESLGPRERIEHFVILPRQLTRIHGELTASLKVRRKAAETNFSREISLAYKSALATSDDVHEVAVR